jgi:hypothetical protein
MDMRLIILKLLPRIIGKSLGKPENAGKPLVYVEKAWFPTVVS